MLRAILITLSLASRCSLMAQQPTRGYTDYIESSRDFFGNFSQAVYAEGSPYIDFAPEKFYISDPEVPIEYGLFKYYWNETYMNLTKVKMLCEYRIHPYVDGVLGKTFYRNGTQPTALLYTCYWPYSCLGLQCRLELPLLPFLVVPLILLFLVFRYAKNEMRRAFDETAKRRSDLLERTERMERTANLVPPPSFDNPPCYESLSNSAPPPSYEWAHCKNVSYLFSDFR